MLATSLVMVSTVSAVLTTISSTVITSITENEKNSLDFRDSVIRNKKPELILLHNSTSFVNGLVKSDSASPTNSKSKIKASIIKLRVIPYILYIMYRF